MEDKRPTRSQSISNIFSLKNITPNTDFVFNDQTPFYLVLMILGQIIFFLV